MYRACLGLLCFVGVLPSSAAEVEVGKKAPDFAATGIDGKKLKLSQLTKGGKKNVALLFSRAGW